MLDISSTFIQIANSRRLELKCAERQTPLKLLLKAKLSVMNFSLLCLSLPNGYNALSKSSWQIHWNTKIVPMQPMFCATLNTVI